MALFNKNVASLLPYIRETYLQFLEDDIETSTKWYGISLQLEKKNTNINLGDFIGYFQPILNTIVTSFHVNSKWIVNHDDKDLKWFPNKEKNLNSIRHLFTLNEIPNEFIGAVIFEKEELMECAEDILSYPFKVLPDPSYLYKNLDISNSKSPFILKVSGHLTLDLLSTDLVLLREIFSKINGNYCTKEYRGTPKIK